VCECVRACACVRGCARTPHCSSVTSSIRGIVPYNGTIRYRPRSISHSNSSLSGYNMDNRLNPSNNRIRDRTESNDHVIKTLKWRVTVTRVSRRSRYELVLEICHSSIRLIFMSHTIELIILTSLVISWLNTRLYITNVIKYDFISVSGLLLVPPITGQEC